MNELKKIISCGFWIQTLHGIMIHLSLMRGITITQNVGAVLLWKSLIDSFFHHAQELHQKIDRLMKTE